MVASCLLNMMIPIVRYDLAYPTQHIFFLYALGAIGEFIFTDVTLYIRLETSSSIHSGPALFSYRNLRSIDSPSPSVPSRGWTALKQKTFFLSNLRREFVHSLGTNCKPFMYSAISFPGSIHFGPRLLDVSVP